MTSHKSSVPWTVTWGLVAAWAVHDAEEVLTMSEFSRRSGLLPAMSQAHVSTAVGLMGALMATASAAGARSGGRSRLYQTALLGFGAHAVTHVGSTLVLRRYTPGVVTAPLVVAPFGLWAAARLRAHGVELRVGSKSYLWFPVVVGGVHLAAALLTSRFCRPGAGPRKSGGHRLVARRWRDSAPR